MTNRPTYTHYAGTTAQGAVSPTLERARLWRAHDARARPLKRAASFPASARERELTYILGRAEILDRRRREAGADRARPAKCCHSVQRLAKAESHRRQLAVESSARRARTGSQDRCVPAPLNDESWHRGQSRVIAAASKGLVRAAPKSWVPKACASSSARVGETQSRGTRTRSLTKRARGPAVARGCVTLEGIELVARERFARYGQVDILCEQRGRTTVGPFEKHPWEAWESAVTSHPSQRAWELTRLTLPECASGNGDAC